LIIPLALGSFVFHRQATGSTKPQKTAPNVRSIAVLPFKPLGPVQTDESHELGIADTLITRLSSLQQVAISPTSAVRKFTALEQDPVAAGRTLGVEGVLDGSFQKLDGKIRVTVRLIRVQDGVPLWGGQFDEEPTSIFSLQDSIATKVANALVSQLSGPEH